MHPSPRQFFVKALGLILWATLVGCEGSRLGASLENNHAPDPRLVAEESVPSTASTPSSTVETPASSPATSTPAEAAEASVPVAFTPSYLDIGEAPEELQQYMEDLVDLEVLQLIDVDANDEVERDPNAFLPNQIITRREYARWLLAVNNRFYSDQPAKKIRPAVESSEPAFQDVGNTNIDFPAIQGLAEAGIIPSSLNGSTTTVTFRPNAPLTRKDLILWKVPLDTRATLPEATAAAVGEAWGFHDAN